MNRRTTVAHSERRSPASDAHPFNLPIPCLKIVPFSHPHHTAGFTRCHHGFTRSAQTRQPIHCRLRMFTRSHPQPVVVEMRPSQFHRPQMHKHRPLPRAPKLPFQLSTSLIAFLQNEHPKAAETPATPGTASASSSSVAPDSVALPARTSAIPSTTSGVATRPPPRVFPSSAATQRRSPQTG